MVELIADNSQLHQSNRPIWCGFHNSVVTQLCDKKYKRSNIFPSDGKYLS